MKPGITAHSPPLSGSHIPSPPLMSTPRAPSGCAAKALPRGVLMVPEILRMGPRSQFDTDRQDEQQQAWKNHQQHGEIISMFPIFLIVINSKHGKKRKKGHHLSPYHGHWQEYWYHNGTTVCLQIKSLRHSTTMHHHGITVPSINVSPFSSQASTSYRLQRAAS